MTVHNDELHVAGAIESVLAQTLTDFELLVVDDASTDRSREIAESFRDRRIRVVANADNLGLTRSLNLGLSLIRSEYVARLDGNDLSLPERLEKQVAWLDAHPRVAALGVQAVPVDVRGRRIRRVPWFHAHWRRPAGGLPMEWYRAFDNPFVHSGVMFRREVVARLGGYDERRALDQDAELWRRIGEEWELANLDEELVAYRQDPRSMTGDPTRPERHGYADAKAAMVHGLLRRLLRDEGVPLRWAGLWVAANDPTARMTCSEVGELVEALDACATRFFALHPASRKDLAIARHRASMVSRLVDKSDRRTTLALYRRMATLDARAAGMVLPRVLALLLFGNGLVRSWRRRPR